MKYLINCLKHFFRICKHKYIVFKLCCKVGIPFRGIFHDLSKFSPVEFFEGAKYYTKDRSPIILCKLEKGFSLAWLHHKSRNKHHPEYWFDNDTPEKTPVIPYKYVAEMICDHLSAGIVYQGKKWHKEYQITYWNRAKEKILINEKIKNMLTEVYSDVANYGIDKVLKKQNLKEKYNKYVYKNGED